MIILVLVRREVLPSTGSENSVEGGKTVLEIEVSAWVSSGRKSEKKPTSNYARRSRKSPKGNQGVLANQPECPAALCPQLKGNHSVPPERTIERHGAGPKNDARHHLFGSSGNARNNTSPLARLFPISYARQTVCCRRDRFFPASSAFAHYPSACPAMYRASLRPLSNAASTLGPRHPSPAKNTRPVSSLKNGTPSAFSVFA
jgi:hypothetical protein